MKTINKLLITGAAITALKGLDNRLEVTHYAVSSKKIPSDFDNFRISLFADIHCDTTAGLTEAVISEAPDIICIPGDMTHDNVSYAPFVHLLSRLVKIAPVYLCSGNHDVWRSDYNEFVSVCKETGAIFLSNESTYISREASKIRITGIEDPFARSSEMIETNLSNSLNNLSPDDCFSLLLFHRANLFDRLTNKGFDLILSGHMHGGHVRFPGVGGFACPKSNLISKTGIFFPKYTGGEYVKGDTKMIVTRGIGNPTIVPRLFNRPELCTIVLKSDK